MAVTGRKLKNLCICALVLGFIIMLYKFIEVTLVTITTKDEDHNPRYTDVQPRGGTSDNLNILSHTAIERVDGKWTSVLGVCDPRKTFLNSTLKCNGKETTIFIHDPKKDIPISQSVVHRGTFEPGLIHGILQYLNNDTKITFVDIGANIGVFSLSVAMMGYRVISVEPQMRNVERVCKSATVGGFRNNLTIIHNAMSDSRGEVQLVNVKNTFGCTYVSEHKTDTNSESVQSILLDDLLEIFKLRQVVMKIDVERFEHKVLAGGTKFFDQVDVKTVCMEIQHHKHSPSAQQIIDFFMKRGFVAFEASMTVHQDVEYSGKGLDPTAFSKWPNNVYWVKQ